MPIYVNGHPRRGHIFSVDCPCDPEVDDLDNVIHNDVLDGYGPES